MTNHISRAAIREIGRDALISLGSSLHLSDDAVDAVRQRAQRYAFVVFCEAVRLRGRKNSDLSDVRSFRKRLQPEDVDEIAARCPHCGKNLDVL